MSLIRSQLTYCSPVWRPHLIEDIKTLEKVQRRATKWILQDYSSDYKVRLTTLNMLPLMMSYEIYDISFFLKSLTSPSPAFNILNYVQFNPSPTRSHDHKLCTRYSRTNKSCHFYFSCLPRLWNALPTSDLISMSHVKAVTSITSLQPFSRSLQLISPLHISLSMSLSLRPLSTSLTQMIIIIYLLIFIH